MSTDPLMKVSNTIDTLQKYSGSSFLETECSLPFPQPPTTGPYLELYKSSPLSLLFQWVFNSCHALQKDEKFYLRYLHIILLNSFTLQHCVGCLEYVISDNTDLWEWWTEKHVAGFRSWPILENYVIRPWELEKATKTSRDRFVCSHGLNLLPTQWMRGTNQLCVCPSTSQCEVSLRTVLWHRDLLLSCDSVNSGRC
jgi:hypothetical protein